MTTKNQKLEIDTLDTTQYSFNTTLDVSNKMFKNLTFAKFLQSFSRSDVLKYSNPLIYEEIRQKKGMLCPNTIYYREIKQYEDMKEIGNIKMADFLKNNCKIKLVYTLTTEEPLRNNRRQLKEYCLCLEEEKKFLFEKCKKSQEYQKKHLNITHKNNEYILRQTKELSEKSEIINKQTKINQKHMCTIKEKNNKIQNLERKMKKMEKNNDGRNKKLLKQLKESKEMFFKEKYELCEKFEERKIQMMRDKSEEMKNDSIKIQNLEEKINDINEEKSKIEKICIETKKESDNLKKQFRESKKKMQKHAEQSKQEFDKTIADLKKQLRDENLRNEKIEFKLKEFKHRESEITRKEENIVRSQFSVDFIERRTNLKYERRMISEKEKRDKIIKEANILSTEMRENFDMLIKKINEI